MGAANRILDARRDAEYIVVMTAAEKIVSEAIELAPPLRAFLAEKLIESLDTIAGDELSSSWREEIRRRYNEIEQGTVELRDAELVFSQAYDALQ